MPFSLVRDRPQQERRLARPSPLPPLRPGIGHRPSDYAPASTDGSKPREKRLRAWIELAVFSTASTVSYWASGGFPEDSDFRLT
ncbi:MAG: hypothetical protein ACM32H_05620, partial [Candidatus Aminicenantes bacterium RBG_16_66_30]